MPNAELEEELPDNGQTCLRDTDSPITDDPSVQNADDKQGHHHAANTRHVNGPSPEPGHEEEPAGGCGDQSHRGPNNIEVVDESRLESNLFEEVSGRIGELAATDDLACEAKAGNLCPTQLKSFEAIFV